MTLSGQFSAIAPVDLFVHRSASSDLPPTSFQDLTELAIALGSASSTFFALHPPPGLAPALATTSLFLLLKSTTALVIVVRDIPVNSDNRVIPPRP